MPSRQNTPDELQEAVDLVTRYGTAQAASSYTDLAPSTIRYRYDKAVDQGFTPSVEPEVNHESKSLKRKVKELQRQLDVAEKQADLSEDARRRIVQLSEIEPDPPEWALTPPKSHKTPGVPTLMCSDWHWGEVVRKSELGGIENSYNLGIAKNRAQKVISVTIDLLKNHMVYPEYPGFVLVLGGDMISGDIHAELTETNEKPVMATFVDLYETLITCINMLQEAFGEVFVVGVVGNHGRSTLKPRNKFRVHTNFDWLLYHMLAGHFRENKHIKWRIPESADTMYKIFDHRYMLTHGDQFRGGDGIIGPIGPIVRGDVKKRVRQMQVEQNYDTLLMGHFHQSIMTRKFIVNGSLIGTSEYSYLGNFPYEPPIQNLWMTHHQHGITFMMPVYVEGNQRPQPVKWVTVPEYKP